MTDGRGEWFEMLPDQRYLFEARSRKPQSSESLSRSFELIGELDVGRLVRALTVLVQQHEAFRLRFKRSEDGVPLQVVDEPGYEDAAIEFIQIVPESASHTQSYISRLFQSDAAHWDDKTEKPYRFRLIRISHVQHFLMVSVQHMIADAQSLWIIERDIFAAYVAGDLDYPPSHERAFRDAVERRSFRPAAVARNTAYWQARAREFPGRVQTRASATPEQEYKALIRESIVMDSAAAVQLRRAGKISGMSVPEILLGRFVRATFRHLMGDRLVVTVLMDGRGAAESDVIADFSTSMPVLFRRTEADRQASARETLFAALMHSEIDVALPEDFAASRRESLGIYADAPVSFNYLRGAQTSTEEFEVDGLVVIQRHHFRRSLDEHSLRLTIIDRGDSISIALLYDPNRFGAEDAAALVREIADGAQPRVSGADKLPPSEVEHRIPVLAANGDVLYLVDSAEIEDTIRGYPGVEDARVTLGVDGALEAVVSATVGTTVVDLRRYCLEQATSQYFALPRRIEIHSEVAG